MSRIASTRIPPTMPTASAFEVASSALASVRPTAAPPALRRAISSVAMPIATNQPKNALPQCRPPNSSRWRSSADRRRSLPARPKRPSSVPPASPTERLPVLDDLVMFIPSSRDDADPASAAVVVDVDALGAHGLRDRLLAGLDVLLEADAFLRHRLLADHDLLLVEHDLVLLLGDVRALERVARVGVGDRLAL